MDTGMSPTSERRLGPGRTRVQSVERAAALLRAVAAATGPAGSATALAEAAGLNRTTTWRILTTLEQQRLVAYDKESGTYVFTRSLATLDVDREADLGSYWEPNVWVRHRVG